MLKNRSCEPNLITSKNITQLVSVFTSRSLAYELHVGLTMRMKDYHNLVIKRVQII